MKIAHLAIRVDDLKAAGEFYQDVLGFNDVRQGHTRDHYSRHLTDGNLDIALIQYDKGASSGEAKAAGEGPCIHHFGMEVDDLDEWLSKIKELGCEIISNPGVVPVKFRAPGGIVAEVAPKGHFDLTPR
jgi:lactoylglutathione lyase